MTTAIQEGTLVGKGHFELIKGDFSPEDALEIINYLLSKKITFHELRNFSSEIRFGKTDEKSLKRCEELKQSKSSVNALVKLASEQKKSLRIKSTISIELV